MKQVEIEYLGHSCFRLSYAGQRIVLDPYADGMIPGLPPLHTDAEFVFCSHEHADHNYAAAVTLHDGGAPKFDVTALTTDHDDAGGTKRGKNIIRIFDFGGIRVAHFGDLGRDLTEEETEALQGLYCALIPVGGHFTIDAATASAIVRKIRPRTIIPMHYRKEGSGFDVLATLDEALECFDDGLKIFPLGYGEKKTLWNKDDWAEMNIEQRGEYYHDAGFNCCQSVFCSLREYTGIAEDKAAALASSFGGGMRCGSICGGVTGALMAIGCACFKGKDPAAEKARSSELTLELEEKFRAEIGTLLCEEITAENNDLCDHCIAFGAATAKEIIEKNKI